MFLKRNKRNQPGKKLLILFNKRFSVPFQFEVSNQEEVILNNKVPTIKFSYGTGEMKKEIRKDELLDVLSNGEKKALYLLNIIYEIEIRKNIAQNTIVIADDIADSFDYQNKYAIVEYLNDILLEDYFKLIILTHNFDFYRTVGSRLGLVENSYIVKKNENEILLKKGSTFYDNIFQNWKKSIDNQDNIDKRKFIASIPFVRNLNEYNYGNDENFMLLTNLLHIKENETKSIKLSRLKRVYKKVWNVNLLSEPNYNIYNIIINEADILLNEPIDVLKLENKIVLSIAIRLLAEEYMISKITDNDQIEAIDGFQTRILFDKFKKLDNVSNVRIMKTLEKVNIMTPENIHLNSFMYEPILDIEDHHLKTLYTDIKSLMTITTDQTQLI